MIWSTMPAVLRSRRTGLCPLCCWRSPPLPTRSALLPRQLVRLLLPHRSEPPIRSPVADIAPAERTGRTDAAVERALPAERRLRDSELFLLALALAAGVAAGVGVVLIDLLLAVLRWAAFAVGSDQHLIDIDLGPARVLLMPVFGGLLVGLSLMLLLRWRPRE